MHRIIIVGFAGLIACSPSTEPVVEREPDPVPTSVAAAPVVRATAAAPVDSRTVPKPGDLKTFGDWAVGCDNGLRCTMASLMPEADIGGRATLNLVRDAGGAGPVRIEIDVRDDDGEARGVAIDGKPVGGAADDDAFDGAAGTAIVKAMANGRLLTVQGDAGATLATVSLKGASAALRYIDAAQGRVGTSSGIVASGPSDAVTPAPALPTIVALTPRGKAARPSADQLAVMRRRARCELPEGVVAEPEAHAIGRGKTLVILPCSTGAYNLIGALFVIDPATDGATIAPARTDAPAGFDQTGADSRTPIASVVNGDWDDGVLTSFAKGRGVGDCGVQQAFVWDGKRLRLSEQDMMGECRGNANYITTWRTRVVRR